MAYVKDWIDGIEKDLQHVTANEGHPRVKQSILVQAKKLGDIAEHNNRFRKESAIEEINELAKVHSVNVPVVYGDGEKSMEQMISLEELNLILLQVLKPESKEIYGESEY